MGRTHGPPPGLFSPELFLLRQGVCLDGQLCRRDASATGLAADAGSRGCATTAGMTAAVVGNTARSTALSAGWRADYVGRRAGEEASDVVDRQFESRLEGGVDDEVELVGGL